MGLNKAVKHLESGFRGPCSIITNYTDLHFLFFKKKQTLEHGTNYMNQLKVLVLANNRRLFCSKGLVQAGTNVNKLVIATTLKSQFWNKSI